MFKINDRVIFFRRNNRWRQGTVKEFSVNKTKVTIKTMQGSSTVKSDRIIPYTKIGQLLYV
jgi:hypothetical protein